MFKSSGCKVNVVCSYPSRDKSKIVKIGSGSSIAKRSALGVIVKNPRKCPVSQQVWLKKPLNAQCHMCRAQVNNLQPFTGNGEVSKGVNNYRVGQKTPHKQRNLLYLADRINSTYFLLVKRISVLFTIWARQADRRTDEICQATKIAYLTFQLS